MKNNTSIICILLIAPYLYLFPHTFQFIEMGNDFELLYYSYKKYIFEFVKIGELPLWSPSEALGYTLIFNPFAQYFYLPSWLLYSLGLLIGDLSKHTYFLYTIFGLSIYNVGQYFWLRKLNIDKKYCLLATIITCFGLKLTEILRFPNAVHTFAWFPWILYSITLSLQNSKTIKSSIIILISTLMVLTAGYPYYILYGFILFSFYFFFINIPNVKIQIGDNFVKNSFHKSFFTCLLPALIAFLIVLPWFSGISDVMEITRDRNLNDIKFSYILGSSFLDQVGSWILPPISIAEGHYYFGAIISMLIMYYFYCFFTGKINNSIEKYFLIFFLVFFIFHFQIAAPESSIIFNFLWSKLEIIQSFRAYSRMNILLVPLMSVLICYSIKNLDENIINKKDLFVVLLITLVVISLQFYFIEISQSKTGYWTYWQENRLDIAAYFASQKLQLASIILKSYNNYIYSIFFLLSFSVFAVSNQIKKKVTFYSLILVFVIGELFILANIQWAIPKGYYDENGYNKLNLEPLNTLKNSFTKKRVSTEVKGNTYFRNQRQFNINYFDNFGIDAHTKLYDKYFKRSGDFRKDINDETKEYIKMFWSLEKYDEKIFFSSSLNYNNINNFMRDVLENKKINNHVITYDKKIYDGDQILIKVDTKKDGFITFLDNWSPGWELYVNNKKQKIDKLFNTYKSAKIKAGKNIIFFKYAPW